MVRILIFISILIFIITFTLVFFQTRKEMRENEEAVLQEQTYPIEENEDEAWTQVDGPDYSFSFPKAWYWQEYIDVDEVAVRFITNDPVVEKLGQEIVENQIAMSFWSQPNEISAEALEKYSEEEINDRALDAELEMMKKSFELIDEEKLVINESQTVTYLFEDEGLKYRKYLLVNSKRFAIITAEYSNDALENTIKEIMESFVLKKE